MRSKCFVVYLMNIICVPLSFQEAGLFLLVQFCLLQRCSTTGKTSLLPCKESGAKNKKPGVNNIHKIPQKDHKSTSCTPCGYGSGQDSFPPHPQLKKEEKRLATYRMISSKLNHLLRKGYKGQGHTPSLPGSTGSAWWCRNPGTDSQETC